MALWWIVWCQFIDPKKSLFRKVVPVSSRRLVGMQVLACPVPSVDPVDPKPLLIAKVVLFQLHDGQPTTLALSPDPAKAVTNDPFDLRFVAVPNPGIALVVWPDQRNCIFVGGQEYGAIVRVGHEAVEHRLDLPL